MPSLVLTDNYVKTRKPQTKQIDYYDKGTFGLSLRVSPGGTKTWNVRYLPDGSETHKRVPIGRYTGDETGMSLAEARDMARAMQKQKQKGQDPGAERARAKTAAKGLASAAAPGEVTVAEAIRMFLAQQLPQCKNDSAREHYRWYYDSKIAPGLGASKPLAQIARADIVALVQRLMLDGKVLANRTRNKINVFLKWASDPDGGNLIAENPAATVKKPHKEKHRAQDKRQLSDLELKVLLRAIIRSNGMEPEMKNILLIMAFTGRRPGEVCPLEYSFVDQVDGKPVLNIPGRIMKTGLPYVLPLTPEVLDILRAIMAQRDRQEEAKRRKHRFMFPSRFINERGEASVEPPSVAQALERLIPTISAETEEEEAAVTSLQADPPTPYALRRTVATGMSKLDISREDRKAVLAHLEEDVMAEHYDAHDRLPQKRRAIEKWETHVADLLSGKAATDVATILQFKRPA